MFRGGICRHGPCGSPERNGFCMGLLEIGEQALNGLIISTFYALIALGLAIIFGVLRSVNFAHGEFYILGGYAAYLVVSVLGMPPIMGVIAATAALLVFGMLIEQALIRPVYEGKVDRPDEYAIMITFVLSVLLVNLANSVFGLHTATTAGKEPTSPSVRNNAKTAMKTIPRPMATPRP